MVIDEITRSEVQAKDAAEQLVTAALEAGGRDNATVMVIDVEGD